MDNLQLSQGGSLSLASGALANGTTVATVKTTVIVPYTVDGVFYSKAITDNIVITYAAPTGVYSDVLDGSFTGKVGGSTRLYGLYLDSVGTLTVLPGPIVNSGELAAGVAALQFPRPIRSRACLGVLRIALTATTTFVPGVTSLVAAGVTATFLNLAAVPAEPLKV